MDDRSSFIVFVPNQQDTPDLAGASELDHHRFFSNNTLGIYSWEETMIET